MLTTKELLMIIIGFVLYRNKVMTVHSKWYGKAATIVIFLAIVFSLLSKNFASLSQITIYIYYVAIAITLFAGIMYGKNILENDFN